MIKIALKNISFLEKVSKIPILKYFFILKISEKFNEISSDTVLEKFYTDIYVSNKTSKRTYKNRFPDLNEISSEIIKEQKNPVIHDIAVSSGISSSEFYDFLIQNKLNSDFYISDKFAEIFVKKGFFTKAFDAENNLVFAYAGCFFAVDKNIYFPLTVLLHKILKKQKTPENFDYKLLLFHPDVLKKINTGELKFINYNIFQTKISEKFTFVRVMNILNLGYFNGEEVKTALKNILISMKENAVLLIGRTNSEGINNAGFYRKQNKKLIHLKDINKGSEIKHIIENL
ncbi:MAG: hypothetical protein L3J56_09280 [Bacteroidales bacterium]|nr:hypothetical protein [Bacteroidales bacterium]